MTTKQQRKAIFKAMEADPAEFRRRLLIPTPGGPQPLGQVASDFQRRDFEALDPALLKLSGRPAEGQVFTRMWLERVKSCSKDHDCAVAALYLLAFSPRRLTLQIAAVDRDQAHLVKAAADHILSLNAWLRALVTTQQWCLVNKATGSRLEILAHDIAGSHGGRPDAIWINELAHFRSRDFSDVLIANIGKKPGAMLVILTNAGYTDSFPFELRSVAEQSDRWYFSVTDTPPPWVDADDIAEQKKLLPPNLFRRLWQGEWVASDGDLFDEGALDSSIVDEPTDHPRPGYHYALGLDIGLKKDRSALCLVGRSGDGPYELIRIWTWTPTAGRSVDLEQVEDKIADVHHRYRVHSGFADPWQGSYLIDRLNRDGIPLQPYNLTVPGWDALVRHVINLFQESQVRLFEHKELLTELRRTRITEGHSGKLKFEWPRVGNSHGDIAVGFVLACMAARDMDYLMGGPIDASLMIGKF